MRRRANDLGSHFGSNMGAHAARRLQRLVRCLGLFNSPLIEHKNGMTGQRAT